MQRSDLLRALLVPTVVAGTVLGASAPARAQGRAMIEHIEPTSGPPGTRVQIVGRNFRANVRVLYNEHALPLVERLPERLTVEVPAGASSGRFVVAHGDDEVESESFRVTEAAPPPVVQALEPTTAAPGMELVIRGHDFGSRPTANTVMFGTTTAIVRTADPTALRVIVPEGAVTGPVTVRTAGGEARSPAPLSINARVSVRDFAPTAVAPGGHVVVHGAGFSVTPAQDHVSIAGRPARVLRASPTELEIEIPRDAQQGGALVVDVVGAGRFETGTPLRVAPAPAIAASEPPQGAPGTRVVLRGERFGGDASAVRVMLGTVAATVASVTPDALTVVVPRGAQTARWAVTVAGIGPVQSTEDFHVLEPVTVSAFAPRAADIGDRVTLTGTGFANATDLDHVQLGTLDAHVVSAQGHELVVEVPANAHSGVWTVTVPGNGEGRSHDPFMVTLRPRIEALEPDRGVVGTRVTLRGQNFPIDRALIQVRLNNVDCNVESTARDHVVVVVPDGLQPGPAHFSVVARLQGSGTSPMEYFVLVPSRITAVEPAAAAVGAHVTIRGEGFETDPHQLRVRLGSLVLRPVQATTTAIEFVVPRGATSGDLTVDAPQRQSVTRPFTVQTPPIVLGFTPTQGSAGTQVTVRGRGFGSDAHAVSVLLAGEPCVIRSVTDGAIVAEVPASAHTGAVVVRLAGQGEAPGPREFRVAPAPAAH